MCNIKLKTQVYQKKKKNPDNNLYIHLIFICFLIIDNCVLIKYHINFLLMQSL